MASPVKLIDPVEEVMMSEIPRENAKSPSFPPTVPVDAKEAFIKIFPPFAFTTLRVPVVAPMVIALSRLLVCGEFIAE